jgi:hypothetical protein
MKKQRSDNLLPIDFQRIFGVSRRTAKRWTRTGTRAEAVAIAELIVLGNLGAIATDWHGWTLRQNRLYDPLGSATQGWTPEQVRALPYLHDLVNALQRDISALRAQEREPRQLTILSRPAQAPDQRRTLLGSFSWRTSAPMPVQIGPDFVRANPVRQNRSRR